MGFDQVGVLMGELNECKKFARDITEEAEKINATTLRDLCVIAQRGDLPSVPMFDEHGQSNY